MTDVLEP
jgi:hypothetical protein